MALAPATSRGGSVLTAQRTLTDAEIKALPTTPIEILPPTEVINYVGNPRTLPWPMFAYFALNFNAGGYTNVAGGGSKLGIYLDQFADDQLTTADASNAFTQAGNQQMIAGLLQTASGAAVLPKFTIVSDGGIHDNGLYVAAPNGGAGAFTAGNAANTLAVLVVYAVLPSGL